MSPFEITAPIIAPVPAPAAAPANPPVATGAVYELLHPVAPSNKAPLTDSDKNVLNSLILKLS
jgi:hypothetical protein